MEKKVFSESKSIWPLVEAVAGEGNGVEDGKSQDGLEQYFPNETPIFHESNGILEISDYTNRK